MCFFFFFRRFADIFGARAALSLSCLASVIYFMLLAVADSALLLFLHKLPAVFMHALPGQTYFYNYVLHCIININNLMPFTILDLFFFFPVTQLYIVVFFFPGSQMVVTDLSENNKRADALSKLGLCFGIGMITGSSLGGTLSTRFGYQCANHTYKNTLTIQFYRNTC